MTVILLLFFLLIPLSVKADQQYCVQYINIPNLTSPLTPNQTVTVQATLKNCGGLTWTKDKFTFSYHWDSGSNTVVWDGVRSLLPQDVSPGGTVSLTAKVTAPDKEGTYTLKWDMVHEGFTWFNLTKDQSVEVNSSLARKPATLKLKSSISPVKPKLPPNIKEVSFSYFVPVQENIILGSSFGSNLGQVKIILPSGNTTPLVVLGWWDFAILVQVPPITGEKDGSASIQVETSDHSLSNVLRVGFEATREIVQIPRDLVKAQCAGGRQGASIIQDSCMESVSSTFSGSHSNILIPMGGCSAKNQDNFATWEPLRNGWVIVDYNCYNNGGKIDVEPFTSKGTSSMKFSVVWSYDISDRDLSGGFVGGCGMFYACDVNIAGPKGLPYR